MGKEAIDPHQRISATKSDDVAATTGVGQGKLYSPNHSMKIATKIDEKVGGGVGQGKLYSPDHAIKITTNTKLEKPNPKSVKSSSSSSSSLSEKEEEEKATEKQSNMMMVGMKNLAAVKDKVLDKLAAAAVPSESLENTRQFLEGVIKDFAGAAQGMTKDALHRIKTHLADILPSVSPSVTGKIVDDAEKEAINGEDEDNNKSKESSGDEITGKSPHMSPASSFLGSLTKPFSKL